MASYVQVEVDLTTTQVYANALAKSWNQLREVDLKTSLIKQHIPLDGKKQCSEFNALCEPASWRMVVKDIAIGAEGLRFDYPAGQIGP